MKISHYKPGEYLPGISQETKKARMLKYTAGIIIE